MRTAETANGPSWDMQILELLGTVLLAACHLLVAACVSIHRMYTSARASLLQASGTFARQPESTYCKVVRMHKQAANLCDCILLFNP